MSIELPLLIKPETLAPVLAANPEQFIIVDLCSDENYAQSHLPKAIHVRPQELMRGTKPGPGKIPELEQLSAFFSRLGLQNDKTVIIYDDEGSGWAGRLAWTLDVIGHQQYSCVDGGIMAWRRQQLPLETQVFVAEPSDYQAQILHPELIADIDDILPRLGQADFAIWDARSPQEYEGSKVVSARGGHIPGARNLNWTDLMDKDKDLALLPLETIQAKLNALELSADKTIVTHCQSHHRSGLTYFAAKLLGYPNIKAYHGSWSEWGNLESTPVATGNENP